MNQATHAAERPESVGSFQLEGLKVTVATGRISGPGGTAHVDPKVMQVLKVLAADCGQVVTRAELLDRVWHDRVVTEDVVSRCIYQLRRHLVHAGGNRRFRKLIETLPRRGYRLRTRPEPLVPTGPAKLRRPRWPARWMLLPALLIAAAATWWAGSWNGGPAEAESAQLGDAALVVLPFADLSAAGDKGYLADGITEELINNLARLPNLRVIARTSSFSYKGQFPDIATVAKTLDVSHVLEGSVRSSGNRIRVTAQLVDAGNSLHLWSETFERELGDIFVIQDDIARAVINALEINLGGNAAAVEPRRVDPQAYARNLEARHLFHRRESGDLMQSEKLFREALERDPELVEAWSGLAGVYFILAGTSELPEAEALERMRDAAERAIALDPDHPESYSRLATWYLYQKDFDTAQRMFDRAVARGRNNVLILGNLAGMATFRDDLDTAIALLREALVLDPLSAVTRNNLAVFLTLDGRYADARRLIAESLQLLRGDRIQRDLHFKLGRVCLLEGDPQAALEAADTLGDSPEAHWLRAMAGVATDGTPPDDGIMQSRQGGSLERAEVLMAELHAFAGLQSQAFEWLFQGYQQHNESFTARVQYLADLQTASFLRPLRTDPRWAELHAMFETPATWMQSLGKGFAED